MLAGRFKSFSQRSKKMNTQNIQNLNNEQEQKPKVVYSSLERTAKDIHC